jgi:hypothetical protein
MYSEEKIKSLAKKITSCAKPTPYFAVLQPRRDKEETPAQDFGGQYEGNNPLTVNHMFRFMQVSGMPVDLARNMLLDAAIEKGVKYALFVGEDTVLPYNAFEILHATAEANPDAVVSGVYYFKAGGPMIFVRDEENRQYLADVTPGKIIENPMLIGLDVMLIPISILKKLKEEDPDMPFTCVVQESDDNRFIGEDEFFLNRLYNAGFRVLVNTDVQCLHMDLATGNYSAHPSVNLNNYETLIPIGNLLTIKDIDYLTKRWQDRAPQINFDLIED